MHPAEEIRGIKSDMLSKKRIVLCITGSIAAVETIKLARELIRHGSVVYPVMTLSATKILHPDAMWFATGNAPIIELTGATEHVSFCGSIEKPVDLVLISPCTANTISKIAHGIDDTSVTTFATTAIGSGIPIVIVPAMHKSMYDHKVVQKNIEVCRELGIKFIKPYIDKNQAKIADIDNIVSNVIRQIGKNDFKNKKILIIGGPAEERIDDVRFISNRSSGKTAVFLAKNAFFRGADVELWCGPVREPVPNFIKKYKFESVIDVINILKEKKPSDFDIIIICAALSDYLPKGHLGKISSVEKELKIELSQAPKVISLLRKIAPKSIIIGFKVDKNKQSVIQNSTILLKSNKLDFVVGNTTKAFDKDDSEIWIINKKEKIFHKKGSKFELSDFILDTIKKSDK